MRFRCYAACCRDTRQKFAGRPREFEGDKAVCPRCGASAGAVIPLVDVHLIVADPKGPIWGKLGRYHVACEPKRDALARSTFDTYSATGEPLAVTCRSCMTTPDYLDLLAVSEELERIREMLEFDYPELKRG